MNGVALEIHGLRKRLGEVDVLAGIDTTLAEGGITAFVGPNGAGKTTLFHAITGELTPDAGRVVFAGRDITGLPPWKIARGGIGKMFQDVRVFPGLSARENVEAALLTPKERGFGPSLWWGDRARIRLADQVEALLEEVGLEGDRAAPAAELSWGNQKLLAFARLLAGNFRFVLLDEPVAGVSPAMAGRLKTLIRKLASHTGVTVALIEHDMAFVRDLASRVVVLKEGRVADQGPTVEVLNRPENRELCLGL